MKKKLILGSCIHLVIDRLVHLFEKRLDQLKIICIPTAANVYAPENKAWFFQETGSLTNLGMKLIDFDIEGKTEKEVADQIKDADIVYVTGGNTYYLMEHMQKCNFRSAIIPYLEAGGTYLGCSAGSVVACPAIDFICDMDDKAKANLSDYSGLGLIDFKVLPHSDHPKYAAKVQNILNDPQFGDGRLIALKDNQALLVTESHIEIF